MTFDIDALDLVPEPDIDLMSGMPDLGLQRCENLTCHFDTCGSWSCWITI